MAKTYLVYMYTNLNTSKKYVGVTKSTLKKRAGKNGVNYRGSPFFYASILNDGWQNFEGAVMAEGLTKEAAASLEKELISKYDTTNHDRGYNLHVGGFETCWEDVATKPERVERIKKTLIAQRADPIVREQMRVRMLAAWSNPDQRQQRMNARIKNPPGKPAVQIECLETNQIYPTLRDASTAFGLSKGGISKRLVDQFVSFRVKCDGFTEVHLRRYVKPNNVDIKESELLENPTGENRGQPAADPVDDLHNRPLQEGSTTIPKGSRAEWPEALFLE